MRLIVFEDTLTNNFRPLTYTKPVFDLVNGIGTLFESINFTYPKIDSLIVQPHLADITQRNYPSLNVNEFTLDDDSLFLNGLIKPNSPIIKDLFQREGDFIAYGESFYEVVALKEPKELFGQVDRRVEISAECIKAREGTFDGT